MTFYKKVKNIQDETSLMDFKFKIIFTGFLRVVFDFNLRINPNPIKTKHFGQRVIYGGLVKELKTGDFL